jgi:hypothetical protein
MKTAHSYHVDVKDLPMKKWSRIILDHKAHMEELKIKIDEIVLLCLSQIIVLKNPKPWMQSLVLFILKCLTWIFTWYTPPMYWNEIKAISRCSGIDFYYVLWMQFLYEFAAGCTTVVFEHGKGPKKNVYVFSSMDWLLPILQKLTIELKVFDGNKPLYFATTWVGYTGVLRGQSKQTGSNTSLMINFRRTNERKVQDMVKAFFLHRAWSVGALIRDALEMETSEHRIKNRLIHTWLYSPTYITLASSLGLSESMCLVRDLNPGSDKGWIQEGHCVGIICTNTDTEDSEHDILYSKSRIKTCGRIMTDLYFESENKEDEMTLRNVLDLFLVDHVYNEETIYVFLTNVTTGSCQTFIPESKANGLNLQAMLDTFS